MSRCGRQLTAVVILAFGIGAASAAAAQTLPIENIQLRGDRFRGLHYRDMTEEQRALLFNVVNSARAVTNTTGNGPFNTLLRTPEVGELSQQLDTRFVADATFAAALDAFDERGLVNLMVLIGHANILCAQQALAGARCVL